MLGLQPIQERRDLAAEHADIAHVGRRLCSPHGDARVEVVSAPVRELGPRRFDGRVQWPPAPGIGEDRVVLAEGFVARLARLALAPYPDLPFDELDGCSSLRAAVRRQGR